MDAFYVLHKYSNNKLLYHLSIIHIAFQSIVYILFINDKHFYARQRLKLRLTMHVFLILVSIIPIGSKYHKKDVMVKIYWFIF